MTCGAYGYQGPDFFKARGFQELGRVEDLADGHDYVFLRRRIVWSSDAEPLPLHPAGTVEVGALRRRIAPSHGGTEELNAVLRDAVRGPVGGVLAHLDGAEAYVDVLWVDDAIRGFGHGARLMAGVEREAAMRGAARVTVDTFDFQAPAFYRAQGYRPIGTVPDFLAGHTRHYFRKELAPA